MIGFNKMKSLYDHSPGLLKGGIDSIWGAIPDSVKYGSRYRQYTRLLKQSQWWSRAQMDQYQIDKLKSTLIYSYEHIPFYRASFTRAGFDPYHFHSVDDIGRVPFTDKTVILHNAQNILSDQASQNKIRLQTTGGTTGEQLRFYMGENAYFEREIPFVNAIWERTGYQRGKSKIAQLRNQIMKNGGLWEYDYKHRCLVFDTYHLTDENISLILDKIVSEHIEYLHTYPSSALILCDYIERNQIEFKGSLRAILVTSENLYEGQKEKIEKYLRARCFTFYGHSECSAIAGWCEYSDKYHVQSEYGYLELIDENGDVIKEPDRTGEIVCTGFDNEVMPFIRYKTGDYSSYSHNQTCKCGRHYILLNQISGRWTQELFIGIQGNKISMTAMNMHSDIFKNVMNYQFVQNDPGICILKIVKNKEYRADDEKGIMDEIKKKFGSSLNVEFEYVNSIERTVRGKQRFIVQNIKDSYIL